MGIPFDVTAEGQCPGGDSESCGRYRRGDKRKDSCFEKREASLCATKPKLNLQQPAFSGTGRAEDNAAAHGKGCKKEQSCAKEGKGGHGSCEPTRKGYYETVCRAFERYCGRAEGEAGG